MARVGSPVITVKAGPNVYTALAFLGMLAVLGAVGYAFYQYNFLFSNPK